jgi:cytochrome oxidase Cu insertion factor (SCO1/SenC/PrrC family)
MEKIFKVSVVIILLFNCFIQNVFCQKSKSDSIKLSGQVIDLENNYTISEIVLSWYDRIDSTRTQFFIPVDSKGNFSASIRSFGQIHDLRILMHSQPHFGGVVLLDQRSSRYFSEPGDDVKMEITVNGKGASISFSGRGSEKYNLKKAIDSLWANFNAELNALPFRGGKSYSERTVTDTNDLRNRINSESLLFIKYKKLKKTLLERSKASLQARLVLNREYASINSYRQQLIEDYYMANPTMRMELLKYYHAFDRDFEYENEPESPVIPDLTYFIGLSYQIPFDLATKKSSAKITKVELYDYVKKGFSGNDRDMLLFRVLDRFRSSFVQTASRSIMDSLTEDAAHYVNSPTLKAVFLRMSAGLKKINNVKVIDATFEGLDGKPVNLQSLKGKVVFIDGWFKGCTGCAIFHTSFEKEIYPKLKNNKDFVYLSVNADKKKEDWLSGLKSNLYSSEDYLNVNASQGIDHPFFKYYGVKGFAWTLLIDSKGNILPRYQGYEELLKIIESALAAKSQAN